MATITYRLLGKSVYLRLSAGRGLQIETPSGFTCESGNWNPLAKCFKKTDANKQSNSALDKLRGYVIDQFNDLHSRGGSADLSWLKSTVSNCFNRPTPNRSGSSNDHNIFLTAFIDKWIAERKEKIERGIKIRQSKSTLKQYTATNSLLKQFEGNSRIRMNAIANHTVQDFADWMLQSGYSYNSRNTNIPRVIRFCELAEIDGMRVSPAYKTEVFIADDNACTNEVFLDEHEIAEISRLDLSGNDELDIVRDWFVIQLNTGLRISDLLHNFSPGHIKNDFIELRTIKTKTDVVIPVLPAVKSILNKRFGYLPPKPTDNDYNSGIREVCRLAGITEPTKGFWFDPDIKRKVEGVYPKWQLIASHTARRSFNTNIRGKVSAQAAKAMLGWTKNSNMDAWYDKTSPYDYANQLKESYER